MMASLFLSRVLGIARESIMAAKFGQTGLTDAYVLAFQIPDLLFFLIAGGALSSAFIPVFSEYLHTNREREAWRIFSVVTTVMALMVGLFIVVAWVFAEPLTAITAAGKLKDPGMIPLITHMSRIVLPAQFAFFIGGLMFGTLYARQKFAVPGMGPNIYNLGIILGAIVLSQFFSPGIIGMAWGALVGAYIGNFVIPLFAMVKMGSHFSPSLNLREPGVAQVFKLMLPVVLGLSLPGVYALIMRYFGSFYAEGVNTALNNANQLMQAPLGIFGQSIAIAVFPALSQFYAQQKLDLYRDQLVRTMRTVLFITLPISFVMAALGPEIVTFLFQHGKFTGSDSARVVECLRMFSIGIPAWCLHPVLMRAFFAVQNSVKPILLGTLTTVIFVALCYGLGATGMGYAALPLASSISAIVLVIIMLVAINLHVGGLDLKGFGKTLAKGAFASVLAGGLMWGLSRAFAPVAFGGTTLSSLLKLLLFGLAGAWLYYALTRWLKMPETKTINRALARLKPKPIRWN